MANNRPVRKNDFYAKSYTSLMIVIMVEVALIFMLVGLVLYQVWNRPLPTFSAETPSQKSMVLTSFTEPNLLSSTLIKWASKAAVAAYTFDFVNYSKQIALARPYFTEAGWSDYQASIGGLIQTITQNQLFVNGIVSAPPVVSNQGYLPGRGYTWRVQIPFLVTYQSAGQTSRARYTVIITIVKVPTSVNPAGIGIDQFVMA